MNNSKRLRIVTPKQKLAAILILILIIVLLFWANFLAGIIAAIILPVHFFFHLRARPETSTDVLREKELEIQRTVMRPYIKPISLIILGVVVLNITFYTLTKNSGLLFVIDFILLFLGIIIVGNIYGKRRRKMDVEDMTVVSREMGFVYSPVGDISTIHERFLALAQEPEKSQSTNVFSGIIEEYPTKIFDFYYVWMKKAAYTTTVLEITNSRKCPKMLIISKNDEFGDTFSPSKIFPCVSVELEGNFSDYFSLFVEPGAEDEIRQILTPDLMAELIDNMPNLSFMFFDHQIYVVMTNNSNHNFLKDNLVNQVNKVRFIITKWSPSLARMNQ